MATVSDRLSFATESASVTEGLRDQEETALLIRSHTRMPKLQNISQISPHYLRCIEGAPATVRRANGMVPYDLVHAA